MGNNPISRIDPNGGSDGGPGDPPTINLDTVVITGHCGSNCGNGIGGNGLINNTIDIATGRSFIIFSMSAINSFGSNLTLNTVKRPAISSYDSEHELAARLGDLTGNVASIFAGDFEIGVGEGIGVAGIVGSPETLGLSLALVPAGAAVATHGTGMAVIGTIQTAGSISGLVNYFSKRGTHNVGKGKPKMGNNKTKNEEVTSLVKKYKLNREQQRKLHDYITGENYTRSQIDKIIKTGEYLK